MPYTHLNIPNEQEKKDMQTKCALWILYWILMITMITFTLVVYVTRLNEWKSECNTLMINYFRSGMNQTYISDEQLTRCLSYE